jgi:thiosulfate reductase cytochrome b subunit
MDQGKPMPEGAPVVGGGGEPTAASALPRQEGSGREGGVEAVGGLPHRQAQGQDDDGRKTTTANANTEILSEAQNDSVGDVGDNDDVAGEGTVAPQTVSTATIRLEKKHPLAIRWMHWINFPVLFTMIWSGLLIYWNDSDNAYKYPHEVYRVGVGPVTLLRMFPAWFYTNRFWDMRYHVTEGLGYHFFFMWIFAINGLLYVTYLVASGNWRLMVPTMRSWKEAVQVTLFDLHLSKVHPPVRKYNGAQKIAYTAIILMGAGSLVTGLSIYKPTQVHWLTTLLGGYEMARWEHFWLTMGFCGFFLLHVFQVVKTGWNNFRGMVSGMEIRPADAAPYVEERRDA